MIELGHVAVASWPGDVVGNFGSRAEAEIDRFVQLKQVMSDG
jgi:hypothetical protein